MDFQDVIIQTSNQSLTYMGGGVMIILFMFVVMNANGLPFVNILGLLFIGIFSVVFGSVTINCMIDGDCHVFAWIWVITGLIFLLSNMIIQTVTYKT